MTTLQILHNIFLDEKQRYALTAGELIETIGVSVPVWFYKLNTSEPAEEIFVKYRIQIDDHGPKILVGKQGYRISLPKIDPDIPVRPININEMSLVEKLEWFKNNPIPLSCRDLLNPEDGGIKCLDFIKSNLMKSGSKKRKIMNLLKK